MGPDHLLQSVPSGYRLLLRPDDFDAAVFERLVGEGRRRRAVGDAPSAIELLEKALGLWHGAALGELATETSMRGYAQQLEELRLHAIEERGEAMVASVVTASSSPSCTTWSPSIRSASNSGRS